jgi:hypothetical protein
MPSSFIPSSYPVIHFAIFFRWNQLLFLERIQRERERERERFSLRSENCCTIMQKRMDDCWPFKVTFDTRYFKTRRHKRAGDLSVSFCLKHNLTKRENGKRMSGQDDTPFTSNITSYIKDTLSKREQHTRQEWNNKKVRKEHWQKKSKRKEDQSLWRSNDFLDSLIVRSGVRIWGGNAQQSLTDTTKKMRREKSCWWKGSSHGHLVRPTQQTIYNNIKKERKNHISSEIFAKYYWCCKRCVLQSHPRQVENCPT